MNNLLFEELLIEARRADAERADMRRAEAEYARDHEGQSVRASIASALVWLAMHVDAGAGRRAAAPTR